MIFWTRFALLYCGDVVASWLLPLGCWWRGFHKDINLNYRQHLCLHCGRETEA